MCGLLYKWRLFTCSTQVSTVRAFDRIALAMSFMRLFKHTPGIAANCFQNLSICVHLCIAAVPSLLTAKRSKHHMSAGTLTPTPYICRMHLTILNFSIWCFWTSLAPWRRRMPHSHLTVGGTAIHTFLTHRSALCSCSINIPNDVWGGSVSPEVRP